jgi:flagellar protein FlaG
MVSGPLPISSRNIVAQGSPGASGSRAGASFVPKGTKDEPAGESLDLQALTEEVYQKMNLIHDVDLRYSVDDGSGQVVVTVTDATTGKVIREIPPAEILNLAARLDEMIGLLFDQVG